MKEIIDGYKALRAHIFAFGVDQKGLELFKALDEVVKKNEEVKATKQTATVAP